MNLQEIKLFLGKIKDSVKKIKKPFLYALGYNSSIENIFGYWWGMGEDWDD